MITDDLDLIVSPVTRLHFAHQFWHAPSFYGEEVSLNGLA